MSSSTRVFAILDLFTPEKPVWQPDQINQALGYSRPTGYRYVKELVEAGMLQKVSAGHYALGARIIELDFKLRASDPILLAAVPEMALLAESSGYDIVLSMLYGGPRVVDVHRASGEKNLELFYGRGRPRPMFRAAAPKILMAWLARGPLLKIYDANAEQIANNGMGESWAEFRAYLSEVRRRGFYRSAGELQADVGALALPVINCDQECVGALAMVGSLPRFAQEPDDKIIARLQQASDTIREKLSQETRQN